ncbi:MAG: TolB family protein [Candidatus Omnitrophota bacterium]
MNKTFFLTFLIVLTAQGASAGEAVIFSRVTDGYWQIWAMNPDGTKQTQITNSQTDKRNPVCMNNGTGVLYRTNNGQLFFKNLSSSEERELLSKYQIINNPDVCLSNNDLLFVRFDPRENDISDIWASDPRGNDPRILTKDKRLKYQPVYNADCTEIAFVKADDNKGAHHIWLMSASGENLRQLTDGEKGFDVLPDFFLDRKGLVFSSNRDGEDYEIYAVNLEDRSLTKLTDNAVLDTSPAVSHNGGIVFVSSRSGSQQLWRMNVDGTNAVQLTDGQDEAIDPNWCEVTTDKER